VIGLRWVRDGCGKSGLDHLVSEHFWMDGGGGKKERKMKKGLECSPRMNEKGKQISLYNF
jgi:hypothetical protein